MVLCLLYHFPHDKGTCSSYFSPRFRQNRPPILTRHWNDPSKRARPWGASLRCWNRRPAGISAAIRTSSNRTNLGTIIRNVNALGVEKAYVVTAHKWLPDDWADMRTRSKLHSVSASAIKWSFVKKFENTASCLEHLKKNRFQSIVTSPHTKGRKNVILHEADYTGFKKLAVWFGNEGTGISSLALEHSELCVNIPMFGIIESLNLGTSSGIVLYEITKQRRAFQDRLSARVAANKSRKRRRSS
jgi:tRNA (guanosine-2'-O-)-methyltransferase